MMESVSGSASTFNFPESKSGTRFNIEPIMALISYVIRPATGTNSRDACRLQPSNSAYLSSWFGGLKNHSQRLKVPNSPYRLFRKLDTQQGFHAFQKEISWFTTIACFVVAIRYWVVVAWILTLALVLSILAMATLTLNWDPRTQSFEEWNAGSVLVKGWGRLVNSSKSSPSSWKGLKFRVTRSVNS